MVFKFTHLSIENILKNNTNKYSIKKILDEKFPLARNNSLY